ncbi:hypothetical protein EDB19DRAFT_292268 [Suillus lakei]|nr:hypothetical protein EDB19DRAFT_292268 [Suillus lakei]
MVQTMMQYPPAHYSTTTGTVLDCIYPMERSSPQKHLHIQLRKRSLVRPHTSRNNPPTCSNAQGIHTTTALPKCCPLFMRLREYHCVDPQDAVPCGGADDGFDDGRCMSV